MRKQKQNNGGKHEFGNIEMNSARFEKSQNGKDELENRTRAILKLCAGGSSNLWHAYTFSDRKA